MKAARARTRDAAGGAPRPRALGACAAFTIGAAASAPALAQNLLGCPGPSLDEWLTLGGFSTRDAVRGAAAPSFSPSWIAHQDETGTTIRFLNQAGVAVVPRTQGNVVIALGKVSRPGGPANQTRVFALSRDDASVVWSQPLTYPPVFDSVTGPTVDLERRRVIVCAGASVTALDLDDGSLRWQAILPGNVVNASPVITQDLWPGNRLFITDVGIRSNPPPPSPLPPSRSRLHCINVDPMGPGNPYTPGQILWTVETGSAWAPGASPSYLPLCKGGYGLVYVTCNGNDGIGQIRAYPATTSEAPAFVWKFDNPTGAGFYGGITVVPPADSLMPPYLLAGSYEFFGGLDSGNLVKVSGLTGELIWSAPANRTNALPVPLPGGRVVVPGGIDGYGTVPSLDLYQDNGATVTHCWNTAVDTWNDLDEDGELDPGEYFAVGGWTQQGIAFTFGGRTVLVVGRGPSGLATQASEELFALNVDRKPDDSGFVVDDESLAGGPPALGGAALYSVGEDGLASLGLCPTAVDVDLDGRSSVDDLYAWHAGVGSRDVNGDGVVNELDLESLIGSLRSAEFAGGIRRGGPE